MSDIKIPLPLLNSSIGFFCTGQGCILHRWRQAMKDVIPVFVLFSAPQTTEIYGFLVHRGWENRCMHELNNLNKSICFFQLKTWSAPELQESKLNHERDLIVVGPVSPKTAPSELWLILSLPGIHCIVLNFFNDYWFGTAHSRYYSLLMDFITISVPNRGIPFCMVPMWMKKIILRNIHHHGIRSWLWISVFLMKWGTAPFSQEFRAVYGIVKDITTKCWWLPGFIAGSGRDVW